MAYSPDRRYLYVYVTRWYSVVCTLNGLQTFIHRFDSDRRLQSTQQLTNQHIRRWTVTVVKNVVSGWIVDVCRGTIFWSVGHDTAALAKDHRHH